MIININGGSSDVQIINFTLSSDFDIHAWPGLTINGIKNFPDGIHGFFIHPTGTISLTENNVIWLTSDYYPNGASEGPLYYFRAKSTSISDFSGLKNENSNAFRYDSANATLKVNVNLSGAFMKAGSYQLLIW